MKSSAPWSVKGVERDARETAKEAARREGMTVGEWLNQVISTAGDPVSTDGQIEGLKISDLVNAIEHVNKRLSGAESASAAANQESARNIAGVVERLQRIERIKPVSGSDDPAVGERLARLEERAGDRGRIDALKALERAIGQVAVQFDSAQKSSTTRMELLERHLQELASRLDEFAGGAAPFEPLTTAVAGISARLARIETFAAEPPAPQASAGDAEFVERTSARLRVLGDEIKRGGDQIRGLETLIKKMSEQIDGAERRSSEGVQKVAETISTLRSQIAETELRAPDPRVDIEAAMAEAARRTENRIGELQHAFESILARLEQSAVARASAARPAPAPVAMTPQPAAVAAAPPALAAAPPKPAPQPQAAPNMAVAEEEPAKDDEDSMFDLDTFDRPAETQVAAPAPEASPSETAVATEDDIESILAELEGFAPVPEPALAAEPRLTAMPPPAADVAEPPAGDIETAPTYLQEARRAAKEAAEKVAAEENPRRKLTPKQRAILAAKIRRKRLAAEQGAKPLAAPAAPAPEPEPDDIVIEDAPAKPKSASLLAAAIGKVRTLLPGSKAAVKPAGAPPSEEMGDLDVGDGPRPVFGKKSNAKPTTLALAAGIALAGAAIFFLAKDLVFPAKPKVASAPERIAANPVNYGAQPQLKDSAAEPEVPAPPVIKPRALYLDSVARLKSATDDRTTQDAMQGLEQAAALGHAPAQLQLGELYKLGQGVPQDPAQARAWYERSANGGNVLAMHRIGVMAARGQGGPADQAAAVVWFEKAANFGLVDSQYNLGAVYHPGGEGAASGVQDAGKAYYWYALAAKNGDDQAGALAAGLAGGLTATQRKDIDAAISAWKAQTPDPDANEIAPAS